MSVVCDAVLAPRFKSLRRGFIAAATCAFAALPALAEPKPYTPVAVAYARNVGADAGFKAAAQKLKAAVEARDMAALDAALAADFTVMSCASNPAAACALGAKGVTAAKGKTPGERLRAGLCCGDTPKKQITEALRVETALGLVGAALAEENAGALVALPGSACLPAPAGYDPAAAAALAKAADVEPENLRVTSAEVVLRQKPDPAAPEAARIPSGRIAPLVTLGQEGLAAGWTAIALPQGGLGFTQQLAFDDLATPALCFARDAAGVWKIKLMIERKDAE